MKESTKRVRNATNATVERSRKRTRRDATANGSALGYVNYPSYNMSYMNCNRYIPPNGPEAATMGLYMDHQKETLTMSDKRFFQKVQRTTRYSILDSSWVKDSGQLHQLSKVAVSLLKCMNLHSVRNDYRKLLPWVNYWCSLGTHLVGEVTCWMILRNCF